MNIEHTVKTSHDRIYNLFSFLNNSPKIKLITGFLLVLVLCVSAIIFLYINIRDLNKKTEKCNLKTQSIIRIKKLTYELYLNQMFNLFYLDNDSPENHKQLLSRLHGYLNTCKQNSIGKSETDALDTVEIYLNKYDTYFDEKVIPFYNKQSTLSVNTMSYSLSEADEIEKSNTTIITKENIKNKRLSTDEYYSFLKGLEDKLEASISRNKIDVAKQKQLNFEGGQIIENMQEQIVILEDLYISQNKDSMGYVNRTSRFVAIVSVIAIVIMGAYISFKIGNSIAKYNKKIEDAYKELKQTQVQLVQHEKMASLGMLAAGVAHEIHNPLGAINCNIDLYKCIASRLKMTQPIIEDTNAMNLILTLENTNRINIIASERILEIVKSLKDFARLDESEFKETDIHAAIDCTLTLLDIRLKNRIEVIKEYGDIPLVLCYPNQLNQVFMNLLVNSIDAIEETGTIWITTYTKFTGVFIKIKDSGTGIKPEHLDRIFDPGFTTKGVGVGTGLGLSIVYRIIEDHKGTITVQSEYGKGTEFTVKLPIKIYDMNLRIEDRKT